MSLTRALVLPLKAVIRAPSLRRSLTRLFWATPLILVKLPPANTCSPSGATASDSTWASSTGANAVSIAPVVASKAKMLLRAIAVVGAAALATWVNWPPATILFPTWTMAATLPSSTCGVQSAGLLDTTTACGTLTAAPGCAIRPTRTAADSSANRTRRPMWSDSPLESGLSCAVVSYRLIGSPGW